MRIITDFHLHSQYSRACSKLLTLPNIARMCERKGIQLVGAPDFTHPAWRKHIGEELEKVSDGVYQLTGNRSKTRFILSTELSCIYKRFDRVRRLHHIVLMPDLPSVDRLIQALDKRGCNLKSDGRPILGIDSEELLKIVLDSSAEALLIPAHAWTPWYSVFGSQSGFDSLEECFGEMTSFIHAIETGLSSDPPMNRRLSALDSVFLVSNSDAHSLDKLGREANVFEMEQPSFRELRRILVERDREKFIETIEFFPEEGKYHADGHRNCSFSCTPDETMRLKGLCPVCGKPLTIGVLNRVHSLADRPETASEPQGMVPYRYIIPLVELVASVIRVGPSSKRAEQVLKAMVQEGYTEFGILLDEPIEVLERIAPREIATAIISMRNGEVEREPGYDGEFGTIKVKTPPPPEQAALQI